MTGISFGNLLIKQVVAELSAELPNVDTFVTLSPIPKLAAWMQDQGHDLGDLLPVQRRATAAHYLLHAKRSDGLPVDPVARFHLGNGAEIHGLHAAADSSERGHAQSGGVMVNYLYDLSKTERHHEEFAEQGKIAATRQIKALGNEGTLPFAAAAE